MVVRIGGREEQGGGATKGYQAIGLSPSEWVRNGAPFLVLEGVLRWLWRPPGGGRFESEKHGPRSPDGGLREKFLNLPTPGLVDFGSADRLSPSRGKLMVDDRSPTAKAMDIVSQITAIAVMGVVPALIGVGLDSWLQTSPWCALLGGPLGMIIAGYQLTQFVQRLSADKPSKPDE